jgi:Effector-associated domain 5
MQHFSNSIRDQLENAALSAQLQFAPRQVLFSGIDPLAWGAIPELGNRNFQLTADIDWLNTTERIADGSVPFVRWLENAERQTRTTRPSESSIFMKYNDVLAQKTAGQPVIAVPEQFPEVKEVVVLEDDFMPFSFLVTGSRAGKAVAHLAVPQVRNGKPSATDAGVPVLLGEARHSYAPDAHGYSLHKRGRLPRGKHNSAPIRRCQENCSPQ